MRNGSGERRRLSHGRTTHYNSHIRRAIVARPGAPDVPVDAGGISAYISPDRGRWLRGRDPPTVNI